MGSRFVRSASSGGRKLEPVTPIGRENSQSAPPRPLRPMHSSARRELRDRLTLRFRPHSRPALRMPSRKWGIARGV